MSTTADVDDSTRNRVQVFDLWVGEFNNEVYYDFYHPEAFVMLLSILLVSISIFSVLAFGCIQQEQSDTFHYLKI